jgi:type II secretory pathway predicted ATPase ExeA
MYERHFGLRERPFSLLPDPMFLYFGQQHSAAYGMLEYGVMQQAGFVVITGDIGTGRTSTWGSS